MKKQLLTGIIFILLPLCSSCTDSQGSENDSNSSGGCTVCEDATEPDSQEQGDTNAGERCERTSRNTSEAFEKPERGDSQAPGDFFEGAQAKANQTREGYVRTYQNIQGRQHMRPTSNQSEHWVNPGEWAILDYVFSIRFDDGANIEPFVDHFDVMVFVDFRPVSFVAFQPSDENFPPSVQQIEESPERTRSIPVTMDGQTTFSASIGIPADALGEPGAHDVRIVAVPSPETTAEEPYARTRTIYGQSMIINNGGYSFPGLDEMKRLDSEVVETPDPRDFFMQRTHGLVEPPSSHPQNLNNVDSRDDANLGSPISVSPGQSLQAFVKGDSEYCAYVVVMNGTDRVEDVGGVASLSDWNMSAKQFEIPVDPSSDENTYTVLKFIYPYSIGKLISEGNAETPGFSNTLFIR